MNIERYLRLAFLVLPLLLVACSNVPGEAEVAELVRNRLLGEGDNAYLSVENFEKLNGYEKDANHYVVQVRYQLVFHKSLDEISAELEAQSGDSILDQMSAGLGLMALRIRYGDFKAGDRFPVEEDVTLIRTEKGWRILDE
ncbi:MAG TPA: hypothetical protein ENJ01_13155 [Gammaproteobacteria bacterium]|nr:hypothetical protein [Gammaproteobacteria bacterium]